MKAVCRPVLLPFAWVLEVIYLGWVVNLAVCVEILTLKADRPSSFTCVPTNITCETGNTDAEVWWSLNGHVISEPSSDIALHHNERLWTMEIKCPQTNHSGEVVCHAMLAGKPESYKNRSTTLKIYPLSLGIVKTEPYVVVQPRSDVILKCIISTHDHSPLVRGDPYWVRNGQRMEDSYITNESLRSFEVHLPIPHVSREETGIYSCQASSYSSPEAHTVVLTTDMLAPTGLSLQIVNQRSPFSALLSWQAPRLESDLNVSQYKIVLKSGNRSEERTFMSENVVMDPWESPLIIWSNLTEGNLYTFRVFACLSDEDCGDASKPVTVVLYKDFSRPENVTVTCHYDNISLESFITVIWDPPQIIQQETLSYRVKVSGVAVFRDSQGDIRYDTENRDHISSAPHWRHLVKSNTNYTVQVCVLTAFGCGQYSLQTVTSSCSTPPSVPSELPPFELRNVDSSSKSTKLRLDLQRITERHGPIRCYRVILYKMQDDEQEISNSGTVAISTYEDVHRKGSHGAYIAEAFNSEHFKFEVMLGDEQQSNCQEEYRYHDASLKRKKRMENAISDTNETTQMTSTLSEIEEPSTMINPLFKVYDGKLDPDTRYSGFIEIMVVGPNGIELKKRSRMFQPIRTCSNESYDISLRTALGIVCGLFVVIMILTIALCVLKRKGSKRGQAGVPILPQPSIKPIRKEDLAVAYIERHKDSDFLFQREYELLPEFFKDRTSKASDCIDNYMKNRYPDIKAYDQTRVKLTTMANIAGSDYINANYVQGYKNRKKIICAQGPLDKTVNDFWRMIWEQNVSIIAMVTGLEENCKTKCAKYWPDEGENQYGDISVSVTEEIVHGEYAVRHFCVKGPNNDHNDTATVTVTQFHYLVWKDFLAPDHPGGILKFIKRIREAYNETKGYLLVHCSAGVGRTGTLVAIDSLLEQMEEEGQVEIFQFVSSIRRYRNFMVQSLTQYIFIYRALLEYSQFGDTEIEVKNLAVHLERLEIVTDSGKSMLMKEFERLDDVIEDYKTTDIGNMDVNINKNRYNFIVPFDRNRVVLTPVGSSEQSTYINASIIQGYNRKASYIITQDPLECTIEDFWRMIHEHCVPIVVMLSEMDSEGSPCPVYWPEYEQSYAHITVTLLESDDCSLYTIRKFSVTNTKSSKSHTVTHFKFRGWEGDFGVVPETTSQLISFIDHVHNMQEQDSNKEPIVVHCSGGGDRSSTFVALSILVHQVTSEKLVDVFYIVCNLRSQRKFMIQSLEQYHFCYKAILDYIHLHSLGK